MAAYVQDTILLFGDSITQGGWNEGGFGARLSDAYSRKLDVLNRGLAGYNTEWAFPVLKQCLANQHEQQHSPKIRLLVIWFGANDSCIEPSPQHVPLPRFVSNLKDFAGLIQSENSPYYAPDTRIIFITPPPINTFQRGAELSSRDPPLELDRKFETTRLYAEGVKETAAACGVPVVDVWSVLWQAAGETEEKLSDYMYDGLHLNAKGYTVVYDVLIKTIVDHFPELDPEKLLYVFPGWRDVNWDNPTSSVQKREIFSLA